MKAVTPILYCCGGLMAIAAIMGTIDYKAAKQKGSLDKLYKEQKTEKPSLVKTVKMEDYSRGIVGGDEPAPKEDGRTAGNKAVKAGLPVEGESDGTEAKQPDKEVKTKKRIRLREFSRAPLRMEHFEEELPSVIAADTATALPVAHD